MASRLVEVPREASAEEALAEVALQEEEDLVALDVEEHQEVGQVVVEAAVDLEGLAEVANSEENVEYTQ